MANINLVLRGKASSSEPTSESISIRDSFKHSLPDYNYNTLLDGVHNASSSGQHTAATTAPKFAILRNTVGKKSWVDIGKECLDEIQPKVNEMNDTLQEAVEDANGKPQLVISDKNERTQLEKTVEIANRFLYHKYFVPEREGNIKQVNEADVVRCATLYLVHPVVQTFWAHPRYSRTFISQSEDTKDWSRTDLSFYKTKQGKDNRAFMILEYKRRTVIKKKEFEHSYDKPRSWPADKKDFAPGLNKLILSPLGHPDHVKAVDALKEVVKYNKANMDSPGNSAMNLFKSGGSADLIKQASAYAIEHSTRYVALFNYEFLVLCYFPWLDHTKEGGSPSIRAQYTNPDVQYPVEVEFVSGAGIRHALLGFMRTAYDETPFIERP